MCYVKNICISKHASCEFDKFRVDTHLCKLRDTPAARLSYGCYQGAHQQHLLIMLAATWYTFFILKLVSCNASSV